LGFWLEDGDLAPTDLPRAARLHERGCALKEFRSCDSLANLYREGRGVPQDPALQAKYRKLACDLAEPPMAKESFCEHESAEEAMRHDCSDGYGCYMQGQLLASSFFDVQRPAFHAQTGKEKPGPETLAAWAARAVSLFQKGCDLGDGRCCATLGSDFVIGGLAGVDSPRAARLFEKGCALKDVGACDQLARIYRDGEGVPKNRALHAKYRKLACDFAGRLEKESFCNDKD
jgi:TPR repeat protein